VVEEVVRWIGTPKNGGKRRPGNARNARQRARDEKETVDAGGTKKDREKDPWVVRSPPKEKRCGRTPPGARRSERERRSERSRTVDLCAPGGGECSAAELLEKPKKANFTYRTSSNRPSRKFVLSCYEGPLFSPCSLLSSIG
jgi:hypothetical protein